MNRLGTSKRAPVHRAETYWTQPAFAIRLDTHGITREDARWIVERIVRGKALIRAILAAVGVGCALQLAAQHPPGHSKLEDLLHPHEHGPLVPGNAHATPEVLFDATGLGSPMALDKGWRGGITPNLAAANPDFDDSAWAMRDASNSIDNVRDEDERPEAKEKPEADENGAKQQNKGPDAEDKGPHIYVNGHQIGRPGPDRFAWFRLHVQLAPNHGPLALYLELPVSHSTSLSVSSAGPNVEVFANGKLIQPEGPHGDNPQHYQQISRVYDLSNVPDDATSLVLVVRMVYLRAGFSYTNLFATRKLRLGHKTDLNSALDLWIARGLFERLPRVVNAILLVVLGLFLLALYFTQKGHREYLWLALHELFQAPIGFVDLAGSSARLDLLLYAAFVLQLVFISAYFYFEFLITFLALRRRWYTHLLRFTAPIMLGIAPTLLMVGHETAITGILLVIVFLGSFLWLIGGVLFVSITLVAATVKRNFEAGLLLIPLILSIVGMVEPVLTAGMSDFGMREYQSPLTI